MAIGISKLMAASGKNTFSPRIDNVELPNVTTSNISDGVVRVSWNQPSTPLLNSQMTTPNNDNTNVGAFVYLNATNDINPTSNLSTYDVSYSSASPSNSTVIVNDNNLSYPAPYGNVKETGTAIQVVGNNQRNTNFGSWWRYGNSLDPALTFKNNYYDINFNMLNNAINVSEKRMWGKYTSGNYRATIQPYVYTKNPVSTYTGQYSYYLGKLTYFNFSVTGSNMPSHGSTVPADILASNISFSSRTFTWPEPSSGGPYDYYVYLYKWNGSSWTYLRGVWADGNTAFYGSNGVDKTTVWNQHTIPSGDGTGYFYIYLYSYNSYYASFSPVGVASNSYLV